MAGAAQHLLFYASMQQSMDVHCFSICAPTLSLTALMAWHSIRFYPEITHNANAGMRWNLCGYIPSKVC